MLTLALRESPVGDGAFGWAFLSPHHPLAVLEQHQALPGSQ